MVKRAIDGYNQQRNDWIERIDEALIEQLADAGAAPGADARLNTETPGSAIDRLSIMSLRIYHLEEQLAAPRRRLGPPSTASTSGSLRCRVQQADLSQSLAELLADLAAGRKLLKVYRQMKMYNDPTMNPVPVPPRAEATSPPDHRVNPTIRSQQSTIDNVHVHRLPLPHSARRRRHDPGSTVHAAPRAAGDHALAHVGRRDAGRPPHPPHARPRPRRCPCW